MHHACTFGCQKVAGCSDISISPTKVSFDRIALSKKKNFDRIGIYTNKKKCYYSKYSQW